MKSFLAAVISCLFVLTPDLPQACSICGCGDPLQPAGSVVPLPGGFRFVLQSDYLTATAASDDNPAQTESLTQRGVNATVSYGPTATLALIAIAPFIEKDWTLAGGGEPSEHASPTGLGDVNLGARFYALRSINASSMRSQFLALNAGTTVPTGNNDTQADGERIDQHAQLGTGAWGPYVGATYVVRSEAWSIAANVSGNFHSTNSYGYRFGKAARWGLEGTRRVGTQFAFSLAGEGRYAQRDVSEGEDQLNTGGTVLDLTPGVAWSPAPDVGIYARAQIPVATNLYGEQTIGTTFQVGLQVLVQ